MHLQINKMLEWNKFTPSHPLPSELHVGTQGTSPSPRALISMCPQAAWEEGSVSHQSPQVTPHKWPQMLPARDFFFL